MVYKIMTLISRLDEQTAAVFLELIQGEGGVIPAEVAWVQAVAALCQELGYYWWWMRSKPGWDGQEHCLLLKDMALNLIFLP